jgi:RNA-directed DNA polymerase
MQNVGQPILAGVSSAVPKARRRTAPARDSVAVDRLVQQAILQVLNPILGPTFSDSSYGFRPGRDAHMALEQARKYVAQEGREIVVDLDLGSKSSMG